jgi:hypothetical protein
MRAQILTVSTIALCLLAGCPKKSPGSATDDAGVATTPASASATATEKPKPPPPPDGATACLVTLTGGKADFMKEPGLEFKMKNTGSRALRFCQINLYGYDKSGNVAGHGALSENHELKPGEEFTSTSGLTAKDDKSNSIVNSKDLKFVVYVSDTIFTDDSEWQDKNFDWSKGPGPNYVPGTGSAAASASAAPTSAPAGTAAATGARPTTKPGRPAPPAPPAGRH